MVAIASTVTDPPAHTRLTEALPAAGKPSVWRTRIAWVLLLPLTFFATGAGPLTQNNPGAFHEGSESLLGTPGVQPFARQLQTVFWIFTVAILYTRRREIWAQIREFRWIAGLMFLILVSCLWATSPSDAFRRALLCILTLCLGFFLSVRFDPEEQLDLLFGVGVFSVFGSYLTAILLPGINFGFGTGWQGIFENKGDLGIFIVFLLSPVPFLRPARPTVHIFRWTVVLLGVILIALSQSRGGWVLAIVFFAYATVARFLNRFERRNALLLLLICLPLLAGFAALLNANATAIAYALGKDPSLSNRTIIWSAVWPSFLKQPLLGYGYGGFWNGLNGESANVVLTLGISLVHAHNGLLNLALDVGLVGVALAVGITMRGLANLLACLSTTVRGIYLWYGAILLLTVVGSIDESFFLRQNLLTTSLWVFACVELSKAASRVPA